jgi:hypothetical protein
MKQPHSQAALLHDLKRRVQASTIGSEPFAMALKVIGDTAWTLVQLRKIDWPAIYVKPDYMYRSHTNTATIAGVEENHVTPLPAERPAVVLTPYLRSVQKAAKKTVGQFERTSAWVIGKFAEALDTEGLNDRSLLRCLQGRAKFEALTNDRFDAIAAMISGTVGKSKTAFGTFVDRHGEVHCYREHFYRTEKEVRISVEADTKPISPDHDLVVSLFEATYHGDTPDPEAEEELTRYLNSKMHREAVKEAEGTVTDPKLLSRKDSIIRLLTKAERALGSAPEPLPTENLHKLLGVSRNFLYKLLREKNKLKNGSYSKADVRAALRARLYEIKPSLKPRKKKHVPTPEEAVAILQAEAEQKQAEVIAANPKWPCAADCRCVRHAA